MLQPPNFCNTKKDLQLTQKFSVFIDKLAKIT